MPAQIEVIAPTLSLVSVGTAVFDASRYYSVIVSASNLGSGEEVEIHFLAGFGYKQATDASGNAKKLTSSIPALEVSGGLQLSFVKSSTGAVCGVYVTPGTAIYD